MTTKQGSRALGLSKYSSSMLEWTPTFPATESNPDCPTISCIFSRGLCTLPAITLQTIRAFLTVGFPSIVSKALLLVDAVNTPIPVPPLASFSFFDGNPCLRILHTRHFSDAQRLEEPFMPRQHSTVAPWNLSSSFPSAKQRGCFFASLLALIFTISRYSSNWANVFCMLWTFRIFSIPLRWLSPLEQLVRQIISTILLDESPSPSSVTETEIKQKHLNL